MERVYVEIQSGEVFYEDQLDFVYEGQLDYFIESNDIKDAYSDDSISNMSMYEVYDVYRVEWNHPIFANIPNVKSFFKKLGVVNVNVDFPYDSFMHERDIEKLEQRIKDYHNGSNDVVLRGLPKINNTAGLGNVWIARKYKKGNNGVLV